MKKNLLKISLLLIAAVMLIGIAFAGAASAEEHYVENATQLKTYLGDNAILIDQNTVQLTGNVTNFADVFWFVNGAESAIILDLAGYNITSDYDGGHRFAQIGDGETAGNFTLIDPTGNGKISGFTPNNAMDACVLVYNGVFNMEGGTITNCSAQTGGGVYVYSNGIFSMSGDATISHCNAQTGGGVYVYSNGIFSMSGDATISYCNATSTSSDEVYGGGVVNYEGTCTISENAQISHCSAEIGGGGVFNYQGEFTMSDNTQISHCSANSDSGGGVFNLGTFTMNGGSIEDNTVAQLWFGNGVGNVIGGTFKVSGNATIAENNDVALLMNENGYSKIVVDSPFTGRVGNISLIYNENGEIIEGGSKWVGKHIVENGATCLNNFSLSKSPAYAGYLLKVSDTDIVFGLYPYVEVNTWQTLKRAVSEWNASETEEGLTRVVAITDNIDCTEEEDLDGIEVHGNVILTTNASPSGTNEGVINGLGKSRLFHVVENGNLTLIGNGSSVLNLTNGYHQESGGGIYIESGGNLILENRVNITNCSAETGGGVFVKEDSMFTMKGGTVSNCSAQEGGGVFVAISDTSSGIFTMTGGTIKGNTARDGAGIINYAAHSLNITGTAVITEDNDVALLNHYDTIYNIAVNEPFSGHVDNITLYYMASGDITKDTESWSGQVVVSNGAKYPKAFKLSTADPFEEFHLGPGKTEETEKDLILADGAPAKPVAEIVENGTQYDTVNEAFAAVDETNRTIKLLYNATLTDTIGIDKKVTLNLSGRTLTATPGKRLFVINSTGNLTVEDSSAQKTGKLEGNGTVMLDGSGIFIDGGTFILQNGTITNCTTQYDEDTNAGGRGGAVAVTNHGEFIMKGGNIVECIAQSSAEEKSKGGGVFLDASTFTLDGGEIRGCSAEMGGGAYFVEGSEFIMKDGNIVECIAQSDPEDVEKSKGGGVFLDASTFTLDGGEIRNCSAEMGGGAYFVEGSEFIMKDGNIVECIAQSDPEDVEKSKGGGVFLDASNFTLDGGKIRGCRAVQGGGVCSNASDFTMSGGYITDCIALAQSDTDQAIGGAVHLLSGGKYSMKDGSIINCTVQGKSRCLGGAVSVAPNSTFTMYGGNITSCSVLRGGPESYGGAVDIGGIFIMYGGTIADCKIQTVGSHPAGGGAVYLSQNGKFVMNNGSIVNCTAQSESISNGGAVFIGGTYEEGDSIFTMNNGTIIGCSADRGGAVYSTESYVIMNGGIIADCIAQIDGGALAIYHNFTMTNGSIINCTAQGFEDIPGRGGGVILYIGSNIVMCGGTITECRANDFGGGVYVEEFIHNPCVFIVNGTVNITGNTVGTTENNVYLGSGQVITVTAPLIGAAINVTMQDTPTSEAPINITSACGAENATFFASDNPLYFISYNTTTKTVQLNVPWSVTYDGNGNTSGAVPVDPKTYKMGETVTVLGNIENLGKTGHNFTGWANATGHVFMPNDNFTIAGPTTLKANWTANVTTVKYHNATDVTSTKVYTYNTTADIPAILEKRGYVFKGWNLTDGSLFYKNKDTVNPAYFTNGNWTFAGANKKELDVYENWTANVTKITFMNETKSSFDNYTFDAVAQDAYKANKTGHTFIGWFDADKVQVFNATGGLNASATAYANGTRWNYSDPTLTLWANFTVNKYNITYVQPDHGTVSGAANATYNTTVTVTATPDTGFQFSKLNVTEAGTTTEVSSSGNTFKMPAFDVNVTAVFVPAEEKIEVSTNTVSFGTVDLNTSPDWSTIARSLDVINYLSDAVNLNVDQQNIFDFNPSLGQISKYENKSYTITVNSAARTLGDYAVSLTISNATVQQKVTISLSVVDTSSHNQNTTIVPTVPKIETHTDETGKVTEVIVAENNVSIDAENTAHIKDKSSDNSVTIHITHVENESASGKQTLTLTEDSIITTEYPVRKADLISENTIKVVYQPAIYSLDNFSVDNLPTLNGDFNTTVDTQLQSSQKYRGISMVSSVNKDIAKLDQKIDMVTITFNISDADVSGFSIDDLRAFKMYDNGTTVILDKPMIDSESSSGYHLVTATYPGGFSTDGICVPVSEPTPYTPSHRESGYTVILPENTTVTPTQTAQPTVQPIENPTMKPTTNPTQKSPAPFVGLVLGLGAALVLARMRR